MRFKNALRFVLFALITRTACAAGLQFDAPKDGTWARYDVDGQQVFTDGTQKKITGQLTVACVGSKTVDGQPCRWIEATLEWKGNNLPTDTIKLLIDEKYLVKSEEPLKHIREAWDKTVFDGKTTIEPIPPSVPSAQNFINGRFALFLGGAFDSEEKLGSKTIDSPLGKLPCEGLKLTSRKTLLGRSYSSTYESWLNSACPFGVVELDERTSAEQDGKPVNSLTKKCSLAATGTDAKTVIPDHN